MRIEDYLLKLKINGYYPNSILDIGANVGHFSLFCKNLFPNSRILMIEGNENCEPDLRITGVEYKINYKVNTIVHSHVFEHIYEPIKFLNDCANILEEDGAIIFSIPNIKWLMENNSLPTSILHFEHTYYVNSDNIGLFLNK